MHGMPLLTADTQLDVLWFRITGLESDLHLQGNQFNIALSGRRSVSSYLSFAYQGLQHFLSRMPSVSLHSHFNTDLRYLLIDIREHQPILHLYLADLPLPAASLFLKRFRADRWIPMMVFAWGVTTTMTCFVKTFSGLVIVRFFLGFCEGGLLPCMVGMF